MSNQVDNSNGPPSVNPGGSFHVGTSIKYLDPLSGKVYPSWMVSAVDELLVKIRHMDIWQVVDICLEIWARRYPQDHKAFLKELEMHRATRLNQYAATKSGTWRELVVIPPLVNYLLNKLASHKIEDYGEDKFKRDFSKRYAALRPGEKY